MPVSMHPGLLSRITEDKGHLFPPESTGLTDHLWSRLHSDGPGMELKGTALVWHL